MLKRKKYEEQSSFADQSMAAQAVPAEHLLGA
jgi:hypothetical protein